MFELDFSRVCFRDEIALFLVITLLLCTYTHYFFVFHRFLPYPFSSAIVLLHIWTILSTIFRSVFTVAPHSIYNNPWARLFSWKCTELVEVLFCWTSMSCYHRQGKDRNIARNVQGHHGMIWAGMCVFLSIERDWSEGKGKLSRYDTHLNYWLDWALWWRPFFPYLVLVECLTDLITCQIWQHYLGVIEREEKKGSWTKNHNT